MAQQGVILQIRAGDIGQLFVFAQLLIKTDYASHQVEMVSNTTLMALSCDCVIVHRLFAQRSTKTD
jgi:hypothetical protein